MKQALAVLLPFAFFLTACGGGEKSPGYKAPSDPTAGTCNPSYNYPPSSPCGQKSSVQLRMESKNCPAEVEWTFNTNTQTARTQSFNMGSTLGKGMRYSITAKSTCPSTGEVTVTALVNGTVVKKDTKTGSTAATVSGYVGQ